MEKSIYPRMEFKYDKQAENFYIVHLTGEHHMTVLDERFANYDEATAFMMAHGFDRFGFPLEGQPEEFSVRIKNMDTPFEKRRVIMYNTEGTKAVYHNKMLQRLYGALYAGQPEGDGYGNAYVSLFMCYDGSPVGICVDRVNDGYLIGEVVHRICANHLDNMEGFLNNLKEAASENRHIQLTAIEFVKQVAPEMESALWESRKKYAEESAKKNEERRRKAKEEEMAFLAEKHKEAEDQIQAAIQIILNGGKLDNNTITIYGDDRYTYSSYSIINYLFRKYEITLPLRTQGWINDKLMQIEIQDGRIVTYQYQRRTGSQGGKSDKIWSYFPLLMKAVFETEKQEIKESIDK